MAGHLKEQLQKKNVVGYSKNPLSDGRVPVYVSKKYDESTLKRLISDDRTSITKSDRINHEVKTGLFKKRKTDVIEIGELKAEKLEGGDQIQPVGKFWYGTLGGFFKRYILKNSLFRGEGFLWKAPQWMKNILSPFLEVRYYGVTNRHVVCEDYFDTDTAQEWFVSPYGTTTKDFELEQVSRDPHVDCALLPPLNPIRTKASGITPATQGLAVEKTGAKTDYTIGEVIQTSATLQVNMGGGRLQTFYDMIIFTNMSDRGDSGSFIYELGTDNVVALLNAGSSQVTIGHPINTVLETLKVEV